MAYRKTVLLISDVPRRIELWVEYLKLNAAPALPEILTAYNYRQIDAYRRRRKRGGDLTIQIVVVPASLNFEFSFEGLIWEIRNCFPEAIILGFAPSNLLRCRLLESGCHEALDSGVPKVLMRRVIEILREG